ncbi:AraC family transcriptional regulator [Amycolatopsis sp. NPDC051071]|uniref:helix-turn-helix domain-containing protein n=1 Tax=Amycolatopsis sp. NPDC051071 TaxID=3154637 RepID=UPI0034178FCB
MGCAAYLGPSLRLGEHAGSVHCFALGVDAPFTIRVGEAGERRVRSALIAPRTRHRLSAGQGRMLFAYLDPGSAWVARTGSRMAGRIGSAVQFGFDRELALAEQLRVTTQPEPLLLLDLLDGVRDPRDDRIRTALRILLADPGAGLTAAQVARAVNLSSSRFQHLFSAHTGTSFRRYRSWARMLHVAGSVGAGADLTTAATYAGFASPGHFSDSFRVMFGLSASRLLTPTTRVVVEDQVPGARSGGVRFRCQRCGASRA